MTHVTPRQHPTSRWRRIAAVLFGLLALAVVVGIVLHLGELEDFALLLSTARPAWLLAALAAQGLTYVFAALAWRLALAQAGHRVPLTSLMRLAVAKLFLDEAVPMGSVSGILLLIHGLKRRRVPEHQALTAVYVTVIAYYAAYVTIAALSLGLLWFHHDASRTLGITTAVFVLVAMGIPAALILGSRRLPRLHRLLARVPALASLLASAGDARGALPRRPKLWIATYAAQLAVFGLDIATFWFAFLALGQPCAPWVALAGFVTASIAATLGPTPLGLGTFEGGSVALLAALGIPIETALTATLLFRGVAHWIPLLPGLLLARREMA